MKDKIVYAFVTNDLNYDQRMQRICDSLQSENYDVTLVGRVLPHSEPLSQRTFKQKRLRCFFKKGIAFYLEMNIRLIFFMLGKKVDIIHAADLDTIAAGTFTKLLKRGKLIFDAHEYFTEVPELEGKRVKKWIWSTLGKVCMPAVNKAITVSEPLQDILGEKYGKEFDLVRNFPLYEEEGQDIDLEIRRENVLLYQGAVNKGRGVLEMMHIMRELPDWTLWVAGEGDLYRGCLDLREKLTYKERIIFYGYVKPEELAKLSPKAKIGLNLLSGTSKNYIYSSANKFFDYIRASLPGLSMNFPVYQSVVAKHRVGELVSEITAEEIIPAINKIAENYSEYLEACSRAKHIYTWENELKTLLKVYNSLG